MNRSTVLLTIASMMVGALAVPGIASAADVTTEMTKDEMVAALQSVATASNAAAAEGYVLDSWMHYEDIRYSSKVIVDPVHGRGYRYLDNTWPDEQSITYVAQHKGAYRSDLPQYAKQKAAVKMIGKPKATYVFTAKPTLDVTSWVEYMVGPSIDPATIVSGTKTVHDDGSVTYFHYRKQIAEGKAYEVSPAGLLTGTKGYVFTQLITTDTYQYGPQNLTLPTSAQTVDSATMTKALAYVYLPSDMKALAKKAAADVRTAAKKKTVKVSVLRKIVRKNVSASNRNVRVNVVTATNVTGGIRLSAKNPWTKLKVVYTIKAAGKKVIVTYHQAR